MADKKSAREKLGGSALGKAIIGLVDTLTGGERTSRLASAQEQAETGRRKKKRSRLNGGRK